VTVLRTDARCRRWGRILFVLHLQALMPLHDGVAVVVRETPPGCSRIPCDAFAAALFLSVFICLFGVGLCAWGVFPEINALVRVLFSSESADVCVLWWTWQWWRDSLRACSSFF
jgi:hypothetical protein